MHPSGEHWVKMCNQSASILGLEIVLSASREASGMSASLHSSPGSVRLERRWGTVRMKAACIALATDEVTVAWYEITQRWAGDWHEMDFAVR